MMLKNNWKKVMKSRGTLWVLLFCLVAGAGAGTVYKNSKMGEDIKNAADFDEDAYGIQSGQTVLGENPGEEQEENADVLADAENSAAENAAVTGNMEAENEAGENSNAAENAGTAELAEDEKTEAAAAASGLVKAKNLDFLTKNTLAWPVEGEVLMEYNMDETIYFPTLNLYQCSRGVVIQAEEGTPVSAPADAVVTSIGMNEQIGNYMLLDVGDGYQVTLGQLKEISVSEGSQVEEGDLLAYVAAPTKYYSVEGDNLYLEVTADNEPVDPLDYLSY
jgi:septal ring factor EnvC (AmiA/AmiB activator)